jgi:hypothetical protein
VASRRRRQRHPHPHGTRQPVCRGGARRRRAQGHERSRRYEPSRAPPSTQAIPASQSRACRCVAATVLVHAWPRRARSAQHPGNQGRGSKRGGDAHIRPCTRNPGTTAGPKRFHRTATAAPKSTNGPGAPSVAVRQSCGAKASTQARNNGDASRRRESNTGRRPRGRREKSGRLGCSRWGGDGVVAGSVERCTKAG